MFWSLEPVSMVSHSYDYVLLYSTVDLKIGRLSDRPDLIMWEFKSQDFLFPGTGKRSQIESKKENDCMSSCCFEEGGGHLRRDAGGLEVLRKTLYWQPPRKWGVGPTSASNWILSTTWMSLEANSSQKLLSTLTPWSWSDETLNR